MPLLAPESTGMASIYRGRPRLSSKPRVWQARAGPQGDMVFTNRSQSGSIVRKVMDQIPDSTAPGVQDPENPAVRRHVRNPIAAKVTGKAEAGLGHLFFDSQ